MPENLRLWYDKPADKWEEALPIGNGRLGGMVFGTSYVEHIQLNEDSIWYGGPRDRNNPDALKNLPIIRNHIFNGEIEKAENLAAYALTGIPEGQRHYEPLGDLYLFFAGKAGQEGQIYNYSRELNLKDGIVKTQFCKDEVTFTREYFASYPHQAIVIKLMADKPGSISFHTQLARGNNIWNYEPFTKYKFRYQVGFNAYCDESYAFSCDSSLMNGQCGGKGSIKFASVLRVKAEGGTTKTLGNSIIVENADSVTLFLSAATTFRYEDPQKWCIKNIEDIYNISYEELKAFHIRDYQRLFNRVEFAIGCDDQNMSNVPTNQRINLIRSGKEDLGLIELYFQYGRYLLISSSRPGSLPANLQGIWNKDMLPMWDSKYTININTQMNYWPAETCNLSECHLPLFDLLERMREPGRRTARVMYGCKGFMAHHNTDIWADTAPQDVCLSSTVWTLGAAWLALHLWEHFDFTGDIEFLKNAYCTMKEAAEFVVDFLIEDPKGRLVLCPTLSPENEYRLPSGETGVLCFGASMDGEIIYELFSKCIKAAKVLNIDAEFCDELETCLKRVPKIEIGRFGQIKEWAEEYEEIDIGHRHISHLFALYPGNQIDAVDTPKLAAAARKTLERRLSNGGGHTGWSRAWIINMWARLNDGEMAFANLLELLKQSTLPNLFDNHPPFQIDGNFGGTAGIVEMLVQSKSNEIRLLPAIPKQWESGCVKGLKTRGGFTIDISWGNGMLTNVILKSVASKAIAIIARDKKVNINAIENYAYELDGELNLLSSKPKH